MSDKEFDANHYSPGQNLNRRTFVKAGAALTASPVFAGVSSFKAAAATPKKGGHIAFGIGQGETSDTLDPTATVGTYGLFVRGSLRNTLTEMELGGKLVPALAEEWSASAGADIWTFKLRKGVTFHNGKTMDADDVIASLNLHRGEESKSGGKPLLASVTEIKSDGKDRVVVKLTSGNADFPYYVSQYFFQILPSKNGSVDTSGVGTGPFILEEFDPGVRTSLKRNPDYFKDGLPYFDSIEVLSIIDPTARSNALVTGQVQVIDQVDLKTAGLLDQSPNVDVVSVAGGAHLTIPMMSNVEPFTSADVRLAMKYAIDREQMIDRALNGFGDLGNDHPISRNDPFFNHELPQRAYDPDKSKFHLKKAGLSALEQVVHTSSGAFGSAVEAAVLYQENAKAAGINLQISREPADGYWSNIWMKKPMCFCSWNGRPTADLMFTTVFKGDAAWNDTYWKNTRFDTLLLEARTELDADKRKDMYWEMQEIVHNDASTVIPAFSRYVMGFSNKVGHSEISGDFSWDGLHAAERWWLKS